MSSPTTAPDVMRGVSGAVLLGAPLLYTQEAWNLGAGLSPWVLLIIAAATFGLNVALSFAVGFHTGRTQRPVEDAIVGFGLSIVLAALLLLLLGRVDVGMPMANALGVVVFGAVPTSIGFAVGNALAPREGGEGAKETKGGIGDLLVSAGGALIFTFNIAPTEEPVMLASQLGWVRLGLVVLVSLVLPYLMVFYAEFGGRMTRASSDGATQGPIVETLLAYVVAFVISSALLTAFGQIDGVDGANLARVVALAFPASLGAALGRVLV